MNISLTYKGVAVMALAFLLKTVESQLPREELVQFLDTGLVIVGALITLFGRWRAGGISALGKKL